MVKKSKSPLSKADIELFRKAVGDIKPLKQDKKVEPAPKTRYPTNQTTISNSDVQTPPRFVLRDIIDNPVNLEDTVFFARPGLSNKTIKQLKGGKLHLDKCLDLHGQTVAQARISVLDFIQLCYHDQQRCILIITGKGYRSPDRQAILKNHVIAWLPQLPIVLAFSSATPQHGGAGALYVLLKKHISDNRHT